MVGERGRIREDVDFKSKERGEYGMTGKCAERNQNWRQGEGESPIAFLVLLYYCLGWSSLCLNQFSQFPVD